ncbi:hypothetical protein [Klebsiella aerogenes]|uniref:hypothetical protein n=1 Tax=Klebsiella aerogenes TaxID=548 RepID=UPI0013D33556|nr:hypothetical protein [Klebsiella aerogenes]
MGSGQKPDVLSLLDISIYELLVMDFSASDHVMETKFLTIQYVRECLCLCMLE